MIYDYNRLYGRLTPTPYTRYDQKDFDLMLVSDTGIESKMAILTFPGYDGDKLLYAAFGYSVDIDGYTIIVQLYDDESGEYIAYTMEHELPKNIDDDALAEEMDLKTGMMMESTYYDIVDELKSNLIADTDLSIEDRIIKTCENRYMERVGD